MESVDNITTSFASTTSPIPDVPKGGIVVKVCFAGSDHTTGKKRKYKTPGVELAGIIHDVSNDIPNCNFTPGDRVIVHPEGEHASSYQDYHVVNNPDNVIQIPKELSLEVASMLPGSGLTAFCAVQRAKRHAEQLQGVKACINVLVVGAGSVGLWTLMVAEHVIGTANNTMKINFADNDVDKLLTAEQHGCCDIIHWDETEHEGYLIERTLDACRGGVDILIDYVGSKRTVDRGLKVLKREGLLLLGNNTVSELDVPLQSLVSKQQSIAGIPQGSINQLSELIYMITDNKIKTPQYSISSLSETNQPSTSTTTSINAGCSIVKFDAAIAVCDS